MSACGRFDDSRDGLAADPASTAGTTALGSAASGGSEPPAHGGSVSPSAGRAAAMVAGASGAPLVQSGGSGGTSATGGSSAGMSADPNESGGTASGGRGEERVPDGFHCGTVDCAPGEVCMFCNRAYFCSPPRERDPDGYAAATAHCRPTVDEVQQDSYLLGECDGPEDCAEDEYCVAKREVLMKLECSPTPGAAPVDCRCLSCWDAGTGLRTCTLCRSDADCGAGYVCAPNRVGLWNNDVRGCALPE